MTVASPIFSVIVPLFNKADYIQRALDSILCQTFQDFEVIVVDDGSTDDGAEIVASHCEHRIRLLRKKNGGPSSARNLGLRSARGVIVALLDGDDTWEKDYLQTILDLYKNYPQASVYGTGYTVVSADRSTESPCTGIQAGLLNYFREFGERGHPILTASSVGFLLRAVDTVGYFDEDIYDGEDLLFWAKLALGFEVAFDPRPMARYYIATPGNVTTSRTTGLARQGAKNCTISPSVDFLTLKLCQHSIPEHLFYDVILYVQSTVLRGVKGAIYHGNRKMALLWLFRYWDRRHFRMKASFLFLLALLPNFALRMGVVLKRKIQKTLSVCLKELHGT